MRVFISAFREHLSYNENMENTLRLAVQLNNRMLKFEIIDGSYEGVSDKSFMVSILDKIDIPVLIDLGKKFKQHSIMIVDNEKRASLYFIDEEKELHLGKFVQVESISGLIAYSIIDGKAYTVVDDKWDLYNN